MCITANSPHRLEVLGVAFDNLDSQQVRERLDEAIRQRKPCNVCSVNASLLVEARRNRFLRRVHETAPLLLVDGMAIYYASQLLGTPLRESLSASLLLFDVLEMARQKGYAVYLLGAREDILPSAVVRVRDMYPDIRIVGWHHGYFDMTDAEAVVEDIRRSQADILLVGMSTPLKERFAWHYLAATGVPVCMGVGGMFDILAGRCRLAPPLVRRLCLEWLYRLVQEPGRLWKRYATTIPVFLWLLTAQLVRSRRAAAVRLGKT